VSEIITGGGRRRHLAVPPRILGSSRRRWTVATAFPSSSRCDGVVPNLLYRWRRLMLEGGRVAVSTKPRGRYSGSQAACSAQPPIADCRV